MPTLRPSRRALPTDRPAPVDTARHSAPPGLARYLALAILLHALALVTWPRAPAVPAPTPLALVVHLAAEGPPPAAPASARGVVPPTPRGRPPNAAPSPVRPDPPAAPLPPFPAARVAAGDLIAAAHTLLRQESRRRGADPMAPAPLPAAGPGPRDRAPAPGGIGERLVAPGVLQVSSASGAVYCLQRPPEIANRDGPVAVHAIPLLCP